MAYSVTFGNKGHSATTKRFNKKATAVKFAKKRRENKFDYVTLRKRKSK